MRGTTARDGRPRFSPRLGTAGRIVVVLGTSLGAVGVVSMARAVGLPLGPVAGPLDLVAALFTGVGVGLFLQHRPGGSILSECMWGSLLGPVFALVGLMAATPVSGATAFLLLITHETLGTPSVDRPAQGIAPLLFFVLTSIHLVGASAGIDFGCTIATAFGGPDRSEAPSEGVKA